MTHFLELHDASINWDAMYEMKELTCRNHPTAMYLTKNPFVRSVHFIKGADDIGIAKECNCPFSDLVVVIREKQSEDFFFATGGNS